MLAAAMQAVEHVLSTLGSLTERALWITLVVLELFALISVPSVLLQRRGRPMAALSWLLALFFLPALGGLAWWAAGRTTLERRRRLRRKMRLAFAERRDAPDHPQGTDFARVFPERALGDAVFATARNQVELLMDGEAGFEALFDSVRHAKAYVHVLFYIFELDETGERFAQLLEHRARQGIRVRVLVDGFGSQSAIRRLRRRLTAVGIEFAVFLPSRLRPIHAPRFNFVNHRKIVVVDGQQALTGGMNMSKEYECHWRDLMLRLTGPAAQCLDHIFADDWFFATGAGVEDVSPAVLAGPLGVDVAVVASGPDGESWIHDAYFMSITRAEHRVWIATPYFIPTPAITTALRTAAGRGADVRVVVPGEQTDVKLAKWASRSFYRDLVSAGVRIFEYQGPMLHAKAMVCDNVLASVGTANIDSRSFRLSFEVSCFVSDDAVNQGLSYWLQGLMDGSTEVDAEALARKTTAQKVFESAAHLWSPML